MGFFVHTIISNRRHLVALLRKSELCRCGCRGWCTVYPIMLFLSWGFQAGKAGAKPARRHDETRWLQGDPRGACAGDAIRKFVLLWLKGDLVEQTATVGLRGLNATFRPCTKCLTLRDNMHDYASVTTTDDEWGRVDEDNDYELSCQAHTDNRKNKTVILVKHI